MDLPTGLSLQEKLSKMLELENMTQKELCEATGIGKTTLNNFMIGATKTMASSTLQTIASHPPLIKYALWLVLEDQTSDKVQELIKKFGPIAEQNLKDGL